MAQAGRRRNRGFERGVAASLAACLMVAACTDGGDDGPSSGAGPGGEGAAAVTTALTVDGVALDVTVDPIVVDGDLALLSVTAQAAEGTTASELDGINLRYLWSDPQRYAVASASGISGVRVLDPDGGSVEMVADDGERHAVIANRDGALLDKEGRPVPGRFIAAIGAPRGHAVDVLIPNAGVVTDVPVVPLGGAETLARAFTEFDADLPDVVRPQTFDLTTYATDDTETLRTTTTHGQVTIAVDADALFVGDSAQLSETADTALTRAARAVGRAGPGALAVIGHTDDVAGEDENLTLSQERAQTVATRLAELVDLSGVEVTVEGRGETRPAAKGTTPEARARNRRVELVYTMGPDGATPKGRGRPRKAKGVKVAGSGPLEVTDTWNDDTTYSLTVASVTRRPGYLIGQIEVTLDAGEEDYGVTVLGSGNAASDGRFAAELTTSVSRLTLLTGHTVTYPVQYVVRAGKGKDPALAYPLGDVFLMKPVPGKPRAVTVIWPDVGGDSVIVDASVPRWLVAVQERGFNVSSLIDDHTPFRFTAVPVTSP